MAEIGRSDRFVAKVMEGSDRASRPLRAVTFWRSARTGAHASGFSPLSCAGRSAPAHGRVRRRGRQSFALNQSRLFGSPLRCCSQRALGRLKTRRRVMSIIPLDLQRRFEQRWAARFERPVSPAAPQSQPQQQQQLSAPAKKRKTRQVKAAGVRSAPAG
jgi:hypothetical protein